jgi:prepilin-type processing-associated H-X9-DG protein
MHGWAIYLGPNFTLSNAEIDFSIPWDAPPNDRLYRCALHDFINPSISEIFDARGYGRSHIAGNVHVLPITKVPRSQPHSPYVEFMAVAASGAADRSDKPLRIDDIRDGTANTILIGESAGNFRPWGHPANVRDPALGVGRNVEGFGGPAGAGGAQFLMVDGSVRFIGNQVDPKVIRALGTPAGGDIVDSESVSGPP